MLQPTTILLILQVIGVAASLGAFCWFAGLVWHLVRQWPRLTGATRGLCILLIGSLMGAAQRLVNTWLTINWTPWPVLAHVGYSQGVLLNAAFQDLLLLVAWFGMEMMRRDLTRSNGNGEETNQQ